MRPLPDLQGIPDLHGTGCWSSQEASKEAFRARVSGDDNPRDSYLYPTSGRACPTLGPVLSGSTATEPQVRYDWARTWRLHTV